MRSSRRSEFGPDPRLAAGRQLAVAVTPPMNLAPVRAEHARTAAPHLHKTEAVHPEHAVAGGVGLAHGQPRLPNSRSGPELVRRQSGSSARSQERVLLETLSREAAAAAV
jgi:hypothetical protein